MIVQELSLNLTIGTPAKSDKDRGLNNARIIRLEAQEANSDVLYIYSDLLNPRS